MAKSQKKPTKAAYLKAAKELFEKDGFEKTTFESIALKAGGDKDHLKTFFDDKGELCDRSYAYCTDRVSEAHQKVLDVALQMFLDFGYSGVNMTKLAERSGVSRAQVYNLFGSKKKLYSLIPDLERRKEGMGKGLSEIQYSIIIATAKSLFEDLGFRETTLEMIADRAMIKRSNLVYHFGTKQALFNACGAKRLDSKKRIMAAALLVLSIKGFGGTTIEAIAEEARVSPPLVIHNFDSKKKLIEEVGVPIFQEIDNHFIACKNIEDSPAIEIIMNFFKMLVSFAKAEPQKAVYLANWTAHYNPFSPEASKEEPWGPLTKRFMSIFTGLQDLLREGIKDGSVREGNVYNMALLHYSIVMSAARANLLLRIAEDTIYEEALATIEASLSC